MLGLLMAISGGVVCGPLLSRAAWGVWRHYRPMGLGITRADALEGLRELADAAEKATLKPLNWLEEYGPLWEPESTAVWLAPTKADELVAWWTRYRPGDFGVKEAYNPTYGTVRVEIVPNRNLERLRSHALFAPEYAAQYNSAYQNQLNSLYNAAQNDALNQQAQAQNYLNQLWSAQQCRK